MSLFASAAGRAGGSSRRTDPLKLLRSQFEPQRVPLFKPVNMGLMAERAAEKFGRVPIYLDQPFSWDPDQRVELDYVEYAKLVEQFSAVLKQAGVKRWDRVAIVKTPNYDSQALAWAAARIGAIPALVSARLDPDIINILLERLQARFVVTDPEVAEYARLDRERLSALSCTAIARVDGGIPVEDLWGGPVPSPSPLKDDDPMVITHTSSTTGVSKLAEASAAGTSYSALMESVFPLIHERDELFASAISPCAHPGDGDPDGVLLARYAAAGHGAARRRDDHADVRALPADDPGGHPNAFVGWEQLADTPEQPFASIRLFINTFDAIHPRTIRRLLDASQRAYPVWLQCYGMTETQVVSVRTYTRRSAARLGGSHDSRSVGWEVPGVRVRIADPVTGRRRASQSEPGMIQARTRARALSFVGTPEKFSERRHGKWFDTGDWGRRNRLQQIEVLDRIADRIEGVESCLWIEDVLLDRIPDAEEIVVVPDEQGRPVPVICMRDGKPLDAEAWKVAAAGISGLAAPFEVTRRSCSGPPRSRPGAICSPR
ncbi:acyl--CoA ligase [Streptacidiphilus sp. 4-A2]|nr:acyl--CoA ligase [Streptacidiphilus sp. 4-A2]